MEELKEVDRQMRREMREDSPTFERIRFFATAPGPDGLPWLKLPRTFYLEDEVEYFQADIVPRHNRMLSRACWQVAPKKNSPLVGQRAGGESEEHVAGGTEADVRPDPKAKVSEAPKLMGEPLTGREGARSLDHRPKDRKSGKYLCWDYITHRGCSSPSCPHAHAPAPKWNTLDYSVQLQLLRRGGLKDRGKLTKTDVQGQMNTIRANVKGKLEENIKEGKKQKNNRAGGEEPSKPTEGNAGKVGEAPPEEFLCFDPTDMEARLAEWTQGGDATFFQDDDAGNASQEICFAKDEEMPAEAQERAAAIREIDNTELAKEFTGQLGTYLRNRLLKHKEDDPEQPLEEKHVKKYLEEARDKGPPEVSAEADRILGSRSWGKVGYNPEAAVLSTFRWDGEPQIQRQ